MQNAHDILSHAPHDEKTHNVFQEKVLQLHSRRGGKKKQNEEEEAHPVPRKDGKRQQFFKRRKEDAGRSGTYSDMDLACSSVSKFHSDLSSTVAQREDFQRSFIISKERSR